MSFREAEKELKSLKRNSAPLLGGLDYSVRSSRPRRVPERLIDTLSAQRLRCENLGMEWIENGGIPIHYHNNPLSIIENRRRGTYPVRAFIAYDKISHHVLVEYNVDDSILLGMGSLDSDAAINLKYQWQPTLTVIHELMNRTGESFEAKNSSYHIFKSTVARLKDLEYPNEDVPLKLWNLRRNPASDFHFLFDANHPFVGYIPELEDSDDSEPPYKDNAMVVYCVRPNDRRHELCYGITSVKSLKDALRNTLQMEDEEIRYSLGILDKLKRFISLNKNRINYLFIRNVQGEMDSETMEAKLFEIMGGTLAIPNTQSGSSQRTLIDVFQAYPIDPLRFSNFITRKSEYYKALLESLATSSPMNFYPQGSESINPQLGYDAFTSLRRMPAGASRVFRSQSPSHLLYNLSVEDPAASYVPPRQGSHRLSLPS